MGIYGRSNYGSERKFKRNMIKLLRRIFRQTKEHEYQIDVEEEASEEPETGKENGCDVGDGKLQRCSKRSHSLFGFPGDLLCVNCGHSGEDHNDQDHESEAPEVKDPKPRTCIDEYVKIKCGDLTSRPSATKIQDDVKVSSGAEISNSKNQKMEQVNEDNSDKQEKVRQFEVIYKVKMRHMLIMNLYLFKCIMNELRGKKIGDVNIVAIDGERLKRSIEKFVDSAYDKHKKTNDIERRIKNDEINPDEEKEIFHGEAQKACIAMIKDWNYIMTRIAYLYFDGSVPLDECAKVFEINESHDKVSCVANQFQKSIQVGESADDSKVLRPQKKIPYKKRNSRSASSHARRSKCPENIKEAEEKSQCDTDKENVNVTKEKQREVTAPFDTNKDKEEVDDQEKCSSSEAKSIPNKSQNEDENKTTVTPQVYYELGEYRLDGGISDGRCQRIAKREYQELLPKKKVKSRGIPNKHLKADQLLLIEDAHHGSGDINEDVWESPNPPEISDIQGPEGENEIAVKEESFAEHLVDSTDKEPDMRHEDYESYTVIHGKKDDCDRLEDRYGHGDRKPGKSRRRAAKRKPKGETIIRLYNMNNNCSFDEDDEDDEFWESDSERAEVNFSNTPLSDDDSEG